MHNPLLVNVSRWLGALGITVLRFNFRGVGESTGKRSFMRQGERSDVIAAAHYLTNLRPDGTAGGGGGKFIKSVYAVGYSFGAAVAFANAGSAREARAAARRRQQQQRRRRRGHRRRWRRARRRGRHRQGQG